MHMSLRKRCPNSPTSMSSPTAGNCLGRLHEHILTVAASGNEYGKCKSPDLKKHDVECLMQNAARIGV